MLEIKKEPREPEIEFMRALIKDRGSYLYCLVEAARKKGADWEGIARSGLSKFGCLKYQAGFKQVESLDDFLKLYPTETVKKIFDSEVIEREEDHAVIKAGYCPLMHAWMDCGGDDAFVGKLCDIAMDGDRAMVNSIPSLSFSLQKSLAFGDCQCEFLVELCQKGRETV